MFKRILAISKNYALVEIDSLISDDLLNYYVVFIDFLFEKEGSSFLFLS